MNKVLITGLGVSKDLGLCETCYLNFSWLSNNPSTLLWADKICVPENALEIERARQESKDEKVINLVLDKAESCGLIEKIKLQDMYTDVVGEKIYDKMLADSQALIESFPGTIRKGNPGVPNEIVIGEEGYCGAWMASIYASLKVAGDIDANCLFSNREHTFLKYLYGIKSYESSGVARNDVYNEIFSIYMPESLKVHSYAFSEEERCMQCVHYEKCQKNYLPETESAISKILEWREYDEIQQVKSEIDSIIRLKNDISSSNDVQDIVKEFKERQAIINKNINKRFPKIERWTKMTMVLATPITIASAVSGNIPLTIGSAVATGLAQAAENMMAVYKSKNNWVGFVNDMKRM